MAEAEGVPHALPEEPEPREEGSTQHEGAEETEGERRVGLDKADSPATPPDEEGAVGAAGDGEADGNHGTIAAPTVNEQEEEEGGEEGEGKMEYWEDQFPDLPLDKLEAKVAEQCMRTDALVRETLMFERYVSRLREQEEPLVAGSALRPSRAPSSMRVGAPKKKGSSSTAVRRRSRNQGNNASKPAMQMPLMLTHSQKSAIALREMAEAQADTGAQREALETQVGNLQAILAVQTTRLEEVPRLRTELAAMAQDGAATSRSGKLSTEAFVRHHERCINARETAVDKVEMRCVQMRTSLAKLTASLKQKEEVGGALQEVDFDQLRIVNRQHKQKIDDKTSELLNLKVSAGKTNNMLNDYKLELQRCAAESERLRDELAVRERLLAKIDQEATGVDEAVSKARKTNGKLRAKIAEYEVPHVMDFIQEKAALPELRSTVKKLERKVQLAEAELASSQRMWRTGSRTGSGSLAGSQRPGWRYSQQS